VKRRPVELPPVSDGRLEGTKKIRVVIADGFVLARDAMKALLSLAAQVEVVGEAADAGEALDVAARMRPDAIVVHASMPFRRSARTTAKLRMPGIDARIIVIARHSAPRDEFLALQSGADGYVPGHAGAQELLDLVRCPEPRRLRTTAQPAARMPADISEDPRLFERLSRRELEVLRLVVEAKSSAEIARLLHLLP
jgi:DNA-binding NarL/FixJ family response regulator